MLTRAFLVAALTVGNGQGSAKKSTPTPSPTPLPAATPSPSVAPAPTAADLKIEPALFERASAWWKARIAKDHKAMYDLLEPAYRAKTKYEDFVVESVRRTRFDITSFRLDSARVVPEGIRLMMVGKADLIRFGSQTTSAEDLWVKVDGQWFRVWEPLILPFSKS